MITKSQATDAILKSGYRLSADYKGCLYFEKGGCPCISLNDDSFTVFNNTVPLFATSHVMQLATYACEYLLKDCRLTERGLIEIPDPCSSYWC